MANDDWELIDTTTQSLLAVGTMWNCMIARLDVLAALPAQSSSPGELVVRPRALKRGHAAANPAFVQHLQRAIQAMRTRPLESPPRPIDPPAVGR